MTDFVQGQISDDPNVDILPDGRFCQNTLSGVATPEKVKMTLFGDPFLDTFWTLFLAIFDENLSTDPL